MSAYHTSSPVLFIVFNRPDTTKLVFEKIREAKPPRLYIAADAARPGRPDERRLCDEARSIIHGVDWPCQVETLFQEDNLGCKYGVSTAITWFFCKEEEGIILEDDCLPSNDFFRFCDTLLIKYRYDTRISQIAGCNFQQGKRRGNKSYYFSSNIEVWGWASWKRVWNDYDPELKRFAEEEVREQLSKLFDEKLLVESFTQLFRDLKNNKIDTWDYQFKLINFFNNGLCIIPNANLITNIGFRSDATHTVSADDPYSNIPTEALSDPITHPIYFTPEKEADLFTLYKDFHINERKLKERKFKNLLKKFLKLS
ncbi:nucleotide-diphospho-sugar transferase [Arcticibacter tournemirensis]